jgi:hypothetical protein
VKHAAALARGAPAGWQRAALACEAASFRTRVVGCAIEAAANGVEVVSSPHKIVANLSKTGAIALEVVA